MKNFFKEFKDFISRGNVMDMAVGIIVGGAFTAIITAIVNNILNPLLAMIPGTDGLGALQVVLRAVYVTDEAGKIVLDEAGRQVLDTANSVILDFGVVISAVITFLITALVLFCIIKAINAVRNGSKKLAEKQKKAIEKKLKKGEISAEQAEQAKAAIEQPEPPADPKPTTEELLAEIRDLLKAQNTKTE